MIESDNTIWITLGIVVSIVVPLSIFAGNQIVKKRRNRKIEIENKLKIHFEDINRKVIGHISEMSRNLAIENNRLVFLVFYSSEPVMEHYTFKVDENYLEADEDYLSFEVHFPERAREWKQLKSEAMTLKGYVDIVARGASGNIEAEYEDARRRINDDFFPLQQKYHDFARSLARDVETISKYQIGTVFKYEKNCPICKKF